MNRIIGYDRLEIGDTIIVTRYQDQDYTDNHLVGKRFVIVGWGDVNGDYNELDLKDLYGNKYRRIGYKELECICFR